MQKPKIMYVNTAAANVILDVETSTAKITVGEFFVPSENRYVVRIINKTDDEVSFTIPSNKLSGRDIATNVLDATKNILDDEVMSAFLSSIMGLAA